MQIILEMDKKTSTVPWNYVGIPYFSCCDSS